MTPKQRVIAALANKPTDRPMFCPAVYEHKARLIGKSPAQVAQSEDLLVQAVMAEHETYSPDMLTVGIDVYNVAPEALGCSVLFPEAADAVPVIGQNVLLTIDDLDKLPHVDPEHSGEMSGGVAWESNRQTSIPRSRNALP